MSPPPPPPPPPRDPLLDDPLFAELVEAKPAADLTLDPPPPPRVADETDDLPVAAVVPVPPPPRPKAVLPPPPPPRRVDEPAEPPKPKVFAACAVVGCFGIGFVGAMAFMAWAALTLLNGLHDDRRDPVVAYTGARPGPVLPTRYAADSGQVVMQGTVDGVGRAAGGRYLLLRTSLTGKVHAFDPNVGQLTRQFDVGTGRSLFAGSSAKLFSYRPLKEGGGSLERWDLETQTLEFSAKRASEGIQPAALAVGAGAEGPVYLISAPVNGTAVVRLFDPETLDEKARYTIAGWTGTEFTHVRATDDGATLTMTTQAGAQLLRFPAPKAAPSLKLLGAGRTVPKYATPAPDGRLVFSPAGLFDAEGVSKLGLKALPSPTAHGSDLFVSQGRQAGVMLTAEVRLHLAAAPDESVALEGVVGPRGVVLNDFTNVTPDQRVHLWPAAGLAVVVATASPTQLEIKKVDVATELRQIADPYLVIGSDPPAWATRGSEWRYAPTLWTNIDGAPAVSLLEGPDGMTVRGNGEVVWLPAAGAPRAANVSVQVKAGDRATEQRFRVTVLDPADEDDD